MLEKTIVLQKDLSRLRHLSWRAGFGTTPFLNHYQKVHGWDAVFKKTLDSGSGDLRLIRVPEVEELAHKQQLPRHKLSGEERKELRKINRNGMIRLNLSWLDEMSTTSFPFREKMAFFWHGHFACRVNNVLHNQQMLQVIRKHALGNFSDLLFAVSKSPAMLQFLNNQQNKKQHPNENFGREVMELFTMGIGNYTEKDVKEGSRGFTGWGYNRDGEFVFRKRLHDDGEKTFLGKTGHFNGDDILNIILEQRATAHHITSKLYRFFVNQNPDEEKIKYWAEKFYQSHYDIRALMENIFSSEEFYEPANRGNRIKSPIELLAGMQRSIPVHFEKKKAEILFQRIMDQVLFYPPNVGGWPGGRSWIDSATLLFRMKLPEIIYASRMDHTQPKAMPDELTDEYSKKRMHYHSDRFHGKVDNRVHWENYVERFKDVSKEQLSRAVTESLMAQPEKINYSLLRKASTAPSREAFIKKLSIDVMSMPEYQLC